MIVVDASALTEYLLNRGEAVAALERLVDGRQSVLHAPELVDLEVLSALRGLVRGGAVDERLADETVADLAELRLLRHPHGPLRDAIWRLRDELSAYDAAYLALAEALDADCLLTADRGLAARARDRLGDGRVVSVA